MRAMTSASNAQIRIAAIAGEDDDPVRVHEAVAEVHELAREEAVVSEHRGQSREPLVRGVRSQDEDPERERLDGVVEDEADDDAGKVARAISEMTETLELGAAFIETAR